MLQLIILLPLLQPAAAIEAASSAKPLSALPVPPGSTHRLFPLHERLAALGQFPFAVKLNACTGSIIDERTILTAGHCACSFAQTKAESGAIYAKEPNAESEVIMLDRSKQVIHPGYKICGTVDINDIAILKTVKPIKFTKSVKKIDLMQTKVKPNEAITVAGYGKEEDGEIGILKYASNLSKSCIRYVGAICQSMRVNTPYYGDSGGPLFVIRNREYQQVGVVSGGDFINNQAVYSSVNKHWKWIQRHMG